MNLFPQFLSRPRRVLAAVLAALMVVASLPMLAPPVIADDFDLAIENGRFYRQANGAGGAGTSGFPVVNGGADVNGVSPLPFHERFLALGGVGRWGYPISFRFKFTPVDGFVYQAFQNGMLQWDPVSRTVRPDNLLDLLSASGFDGRLEALGYPRREGDGSNGNFQLAQAERLGWLDTPGYADLRAAYFANGGEAILGLPGARPATIGELRSLRTQRTALMSRANGPVFITAAGDAAKQVGFLTGGALTASGSGANEAISVQVMQAGTITPTPAQPVAPISEPPPQARFQYRVNYTTVANRCNVTLLRGDVRDPFGVPKNAVYVRTYNDQGNEVFFLSGLDQPIDGTWIRDMGDGVRPGTWKVEIVSQPGGARLSDTAIVRFDDNCRAGAVNEITIFIAENSNPLIP